MDHALASAAPDERVKFHRIWFGDREMPQAYEQYWQAWQRQCPDAQFITWTDADIGKLERTASALGKLCRPVSRADLARYEILHQHGGIYLDCDIMPHRHFVAADMIRELTVCNETEATDYCSIGFIAAPAGHPLFSELVDHILSAPIDESTPNVSTGPWLFGKHLKNHPHRRLPSRAFYPYLYDEPFSTVRRKDLAHTLGIHVWGGSWLNRNARIQKALQLLSKGDVLESSQLAGEFEQGLGDEIRSLATGIQEVRARTVGLVSTLWGDLSVEALREPVFEFEKLLHWLLESDGDRMVWQIGAADGIMLDPLRTALVNYDPPAVLLEPNPYMFERLRGGYRNNRNLQLHQAAYAASPQGSADGAGVQASLVLNAINPAKVAALNLPDWVLGISSFHNDRNAIGGLTIDAHTTRQIQTCIERIAVPTVAFARMVEWSGGRMPDVVVIDAEGMDRVVVEDIIGQDCHPALVHFEVQCMDGSDRDALTALLADRYVLIPSGNDITACRQDVFVEYAQQLYVNNGIPTIFRAGIQALNGTQG